MSMSERRAPTPSPDHRVIASNLWIAERLSRFADLLDQQGGDRFRIRAYRAGADEIRALSVPLADIHAQGGMDGLIALRGVGRGIAAAIAEMLATGRWGQLDRLEASLTPAKLFATIPGIGAVLAERLAEQLGAETLEDLEAALRLGDAEVPGVGARRRAAILAALAARLSRVPGSRRARADHPAPPVSLLLEADAAYRHKAAAGVLRRIAPRRFNPEHRAWLPIWQMRRGPWRLTLLFSNTARAHELGRTQDWVVVYFQKDHDPEGQCTIVTETHGALAGRRVVRGREADSAAHYANAPAPGPGAGALLGVQG
jgi:hypothetical protein